MTYIPQYQIYPSWDDKIEQAQSCVRRFVDPLEKNVMLGGVHKTGIVLTIGDTVIAHNLGKAISGYIVTRANAATAIYETSSNSYELVLNSSAVATISVWIF